MDFAKKMMKKYGWNEGEGLGKNKSGINKPLNAHLKFDTTGLGVDKAAEFNNHWWQRVYNQAANNIKVKEDINQISLHTDKNDPVEISTKNYSVKKLKAKTNSAGYNFFLKSATLTNMGCEIEDPNKTDAQDLDLPKFKTLTDEELFAACGGRTAHKGARHGLNLAGKLERLKEQEERLLEKMSGKTENLTKMESDESEWTVVTTKKNKKNNQDTYSKMVEDENLSTLNEILYKNEYANKSKKKKKKEKMIDKNLSDKVENIEITKKINKSKESNEGDKKFKLSNNSKNIKKDRKSKRNKFNFKSLENNMSFDNEKNITETEQNIFERRENQKEVADDQMIEHDFENPVDKKLKGLENKKNKKIKNGKISKMKCKDKIIAKKLKKATRVLDNLDSFLKNEKTDSDND
ncbi:G patch domain-containing protein 4 [Condylostylus longicornis]|uniref:G patch domain-containing protein 4 n=1 Tax=Condylostylus longicornis TaxID=2530218 RepID=UPI00244E0CA0|nr:G patch domain-containing protein 4 [Condylostylus longicornis]